MTSGANGLAGFAANVVVTDVEASDASGSPGASLYTSIEIEAEAEPPTIVIGNSIRSSNPEADGSNGIACSTTFPNGGPSLTTHPVWGS